MKRLILQILGNRDVLFGGGSGKEVLKNCYSVDEVRQSIDLVECDWQEDPKLLDFPLIRQVYDSQTRQDPENDIVVGIILTNQIPWLKQKKVSSNDWKKFAALDGVSWKQLLLKWCEQQGIEAYPIDLEISDPEITNGVADWEGMARSLQPLLDRIVDIRKPNIYFRPNPGHQVQVGELLVQHSSGTPALSGALYLWGIEQKLDGVSVEFLYLSEQEELDSKPHFGGHWQWRLKVPQIRQLIDIQDFNGAIALLEGHPNVRLKQLLKELDKAVSLNLGNRFDQKPRDGAIERVAIALWSETAFRRRGQWLHWYLRIAGAFELALLLLVERQSNGQYIWTRSNGLYWQSQNLSVSRIDISKLISPLLGQGQLNWNCSQTTINLTVDAISDSSWQDFRNFYLKNWDLSAEQTETAGFTRLRNHLYHGLEGDDIDRFLDECANKLPNGANDKQHPAQIAVNWLNYIVELADLADPIDRRTHTYNRKVRKVKDNL